MVQEDPGHGENGIAPPRPIKSFINNTADEADNGPQRFNLDNVCFQAANSDSRRTVSTAARVKDVVLELS